MKRFFAVVLVVILAAAGGAAWLYVRVRQPYQGFTGSEQFVEIPQGAGRRIIG